MKVLRVYWIHKTYRGVSENHKASALEHHYSSHQRATDFHPNTEIQDAYDHIINQHGRRNTKLKSEAPVAEYAEIVSHKVVDTDTRRIDIPEVEDHRVLQEPLFKGAAFAETYGTKKNS